MKIETTEELLAQAKAAKVELREQDLFDIALITTIPAFPDDIANSSIPAGNDLFMTLYNDDNRWEEAINDYTGSSTNVEYYDSRTNAVIRKDDDGTVIFIAYPAGTDRAGLTMIMLNEANICYIYYFDDKQVELEYSIKSGNIASSTIMY